MLKDRKKKKEERTFVRLLRRSSWLWLKPQPNFLWKEDEKWPGNERLFWLWIDKVLSLP